MIIEDFKQALAFAVGVGNSIIMLWIFLKILIHGEAVVAEPVLVILLTEIVLTIVGIIYLWGIFKKNHQIIEV